MKFINEWKTFLKEEDFLKGYPVEFDKDRNVVLYHISSTQDVEEFDPDIAAASAQNYTTRDYVTWNRPRVFFFTKKGQEDTTNVDFAYYLNVFIQRVNLYQNDCHMNKLFQSSKYYN